MSGYKPLLSYHEVLRHIGFQVPGLQHVACTDVYRHIFTQMQPLPVDMI